MTPTVGATALPAGTSVSLASGEQRPVETLAPGMTLEGGGVLASVAELPLGSVPEAVILAPGAIGSGAPSTALILSPLQWIAFANRLAPAGALANGSTIQRLPAAPPGWYALAAASPSTLAAHGVHLPLPGPAGLGAGFRPLAAGPDLVSLRASLCPPAPPPLRVMLGLLELPLLPAGDRLETSLPPSQGEPMIVLRLLSPQGRPPGTRDLRRFGVAIRAVELDGSPLSLDDPGFGDGFYPLERRENASWRWTNGEATLALPPSDTPRKLAIQIAPWHTQLEPA
jgi:hypothetical protein